MLESSRLGELLSRHCSEARGLVRRVAGLYMKASPHSLTNGGEGLPRQKIRLCSEDALL